MQAHQWRTRFATRIQSCRQRIEVVAANAPQNSRETLCDLVAFLSDDRLHLLINAALQAACFAASFPFIKSERTEAGPAAIGQHNSEPADVIERFSIDNGPCPSGVVADHAAEVCPARGGHVRAELQTMIRQGTVERIKDDPRLYTSDASRDIDIEYGVEIFTAIENDAWPNRLAGQACSAAARRNGHLHFCRELDGGNNILGALGDDDAERLHLINAGVGAVQMA